jgi:cyclophilin family peptidyl-prolyl cis-trans isomerase
MQRTLKRFPAFAGVLAILALPGSAQSPDGLSYVVFETSLGDFTIEVDSLAAPVTATNFLRLVDDGFYDDLIFHRVLRRAVVQIGVLNADGEMQGLYIPPIKNEADNRLHNGRGTVAMARGDAPESANTEFFVNVKDNWNYNFQNYTRAGHGYAVFGKVVEGMDVIDAISTLETHRLGPFREMPKTMVIVYRAARQPGG